MKNPHRSRQGLKMFKGDCILLHFQGEAGIIAVELCNPELYTYRRIL